MIRVTSPIEDTPAFRAGIKSGDLIVKIDDVATRGLPLTKAVEKMRGKPGTQVVLTVVRKDVDTPLLFTLTREEINFKSVRRRCSSRATASSASRNSRSAPAKTSPRH